MRGDGGVKLELYESQKDSIYRYLYYHVSPEDIEDLFQEVVRVMLQRLDAFEGRSSHKTARPRQAHRRHSRCRVCPGPR